MLNSIIWFLTDTDFAEEWSSRSVLGRFGLCYVTAGLLLCESLTVEFIFQLVSKVFS